MSTSDVDALILKELKAIKLLLAQDKLKGFSGDSKVDFLKKAGFEVLEIAELTNKKPNAVRQALHRLKPVKKKKQKKKNKKKK